MFCSWAHRNRSPAEALRHRSDELGQASLFLDARGAETAAVFTRRHLKDAGESAG